MHDDRHAAYGVEVDEWARAGGLQLHEMGRARTRRVPVVHRDGVPRRLGDGGQVEHRVGGAAECHVAFHGIVDRRRRHEVAEVDAVLEQLHDLHARMLGEAKALGVHGGNGAVAGKGDAERLAQAVHGVRGEHTRAAAAGRARGVLVVLQLVLAHRASGDLARAVEKRVQIGRGAARATGLMAGKHRAAGDEHGGDVHAKSAQNHTRDDLVAVGDAHDAVECVALDRAFQAVGDDLARHKRVVHARMVHGDAVAHADGGHLERDAAREVDAGLHGLADLVEVVVAGDDVVAGIDDGDKRAAHLLVGDPVSLEQAAMRGARGTHLDGIAAKLHVPCPPSGRHRP